MSEPHANATFEMVRHAVVPLIEEELDRLVPGDGHAAPTLGAAMRYALQAGGKRVRPLLAVMSGRLFEVSDVATVRIGAAIECLHTYSLVHDDLPAMDDAAERRGQPALHRAFDDATAILAGDALQALAFEAVSDPTLPLRGDARAQLAHGLARAAGIAGMCGGQMLDLQAGAASDLDAVRNLQALKTGALITFACEAGAIAGAAGESDRTALRAYGRAVGAAFQIRDDLLDVEGDASLVGKDLGRDEAQAKATFVHVLGVEGSTRELNRQVDTAVGALARFGDAAAPLEELARYIAARAS
ncbi:MAG: polyprenyl synthetase family protein [Deinococcus-Thermus bacterium]|nr:polyprenyl synthetase family protein [Deinococcota bacterium]